MLKLKKKNIKDINTVDGRNFIFLPKEMYTTEKDLTARKSLF